MNYEDVTISEALRRDVYKRLAKCFQLPDGSLEKTIEGAERQLSLMESPAVPHARSLCNSIKGCTDLKDLQVAYAKLFVGPYSLLAPPYGSIYMESNRQIMGQSTLSAIQFYKEAGLEIATTHKEAPDHIATELEFMYFLIHEELKALEKDNTQGFLNKLYLQKEFLSNHLNQWTSAFSKSIKDNTQNDFYINLADVLDTFIGEDISYLESLEINRAMQAYTTGKQRNTNLM